MNFENIIKEAVKKQIGVVGVDSGTLWLSDPAYVLHKDKPPKDIGKDWDDLVKTFEGGYHQYKYDKGHDGLGVSVSTGYGDGTYPVYVDQDENKRIKSVTVEFINNKEGKMKVKKIAEDILKEGAILSAFKSTLFGHISQIYDLITSERNDAKRNNNPLMLKELKKVETIINNTKKSIDRLDI